MATKGADMFLIPLHLLSSSPSRTQGELLNIFCLLVLEQVSLSIGCGFFAYSWKLPAYSGAFLLTVNKFSFLLTIGAFFAYKFSFLTYSWSFFAYSGKVRLIRALRDCKQRSLTVSKKAPTVSKKASPLSIMFSLWNTAVQ